MEINLPVIPGSLLTQPAWVIRACRDCAIDAVMIAKEKTRERAAQIIEGQDVDPTFKARMAHAIRSMEL